MAGRGELVDAELFVSEHGLDTFPHTFDATAATWTEFDQYLVPAFVLINDDGTTTAHVGSVGSRKMNELLADLIAN